MARTLDEPRVEAAVLAARHGAKARAERPTVVVGQRRRLVGCVVDQLAQGALRVAPVQQRRHETLPSSSTTESTSCTLRASISKSTSLVQSSPVAEENIAERHGTIEVFSVCTSAW